MSTIRSAGETSIDPQRGAWGTLGLPATRVGQNGYTRWDRYRDFRAVFLDVEPASVPQKAAVLFQLLDEFGIGHSVSDVENVNETFRRIGYCEAGLILMAWLTEEPRDEPQVESNYHV